MLICFTHLSTRPVSGTTSKRLVLVPRMEDTELGRMASHSLSPWPFASASLLFWRRSQPCRWIRGRLENLWQVRRSVREQTLEALLMQTFRRYLGWLDLGFMICEVVLNFADDWLIVVTLSDALRLFIIQRMASESLYNYKSALNHDKKKKTW